MNDERDRKYAKQWLVAGAILVLLGVATAYDVYLDHQKTESVEDDRLLVQARVVDENLKHQLAATYESLKRVVTDLPYWRSENTYKPVANLMLKTIEEAMPGIRTLLIVDGHGIARASSRPELIGKDLSDREYFQTVRRHPDPVALYLSPPYTTVLNVYAMNVSLMIPGPKGEFNGIVVATLDPDYCKTLLLSVQYAPDMWVAIAHGDGIQFLMVPEREGQSGKNLAQPGSFFSRHRDSGRDESIMSGTVYATGEERVMALRTIHPAGAHLDKPLVVAVGRDLHAIFSGWRRSAAIYGSVYCGIVLVTVLALRYNQISVRRADERVRQSRIALERSEERYRILAENTTDVVWQLDLRTMRYTYVSPSVFQLRGYTAEEVMAQPVEASLTPASQKNVRAWMGQMLEEIARGRTDPHAELKEVEQPRKDGTTVWTEVSTTYILSNEQNPVAVIGISRDITERKRAEENLRDTKELLALFVRNSPIYAYIKEVTPLDSRVLQASENFHQMIGIAGSEMAGKSMTELFPPEFAAKIAADDWAVVSSGEVLKLDEELNGRSYTTIKFPLVQGKKTLLAGYTIDITERKRAEEKVKQLANELQVILDTIAIGVAYVKNRTCVWTNPAFEKIFGYGPGESKGLDARRLYARQEDYERIGRDGYALIRAGGVYSAEALSLKKDGSTFHLSLTGRAVTPADVDAGSIWMFQDVTERKQSEIRLQESERLFRESLEFLTIPIGIATENGAILHYNKSFTQTYGYTVQDIPSIESWMETAYPDAVYRKKMRKIWEADIAKAIEERESTPIREYDVTCKDGGMKHVEIAMRSIGPLFIAAFYDITDRRHAEDALREKTRQLEDLTRNLEQRVETEVALRKKNEDILVQQSKMAAMGEMLGAIAHQWRQPLNTLGLIVQNIEDAHAYGKLNKEYLEKTVQKAMAQIQHMSKTIDDFRNFYRPDKEKTAFDAMRAIGDVLALFTPQLHASGIHYRLTCHTHGTVFESHRDIIPCPEKTVMGYRNEFEHAILNLVNNAREAILERRERGTGPKSGFLSFDFHNREGKIIIQVGDNGGGIDPKILRRIFEPYFTSKDPAKGTGLGLYMSKVIIEDHMGGTLDASNGEQGAVFTIELAQADARRTA